MDEEQARAYARRNHRGVLATIRKDGRPQLSSVAYLLDDDGRVKISVTEDRAKTKNLRRDPRASLQCLDDENWFSYVVLEGTASFIAGEEALPALRQVYRAIRGADHPNWQEFDAAMRSERRVLLVIQPERLYGMVR
ncbi:MAG TPA: PPOX class F420-dependent oxidoreductase [Chloroflexota bacterium]|nr:PPOX class F420-dependent oxidoreductase [Chloroflexota bacterium]